MISYVEKGAGLHLAIESAGYHLRQESGAWVSSDDAAVQAIIDSYTLDQAKAYVCSAVVAMATAFFNRAVSTFSPGELAGWPILRAEATAYQADDSAPVPNIEAEALFRGCSAGALVQRVIANTTFYDNARAQIAGNSGRHRDAINALQSFNAVLAYDYSTGWPTQ